MQLFFQVSKIISNSDIYSFLNQSRRYIHSKLSVKVEINKIYRDVIFPKENVKFFFHLHCEKSIVM